MTEPRPQTPETEPLTRIQVLIAMGATAVILLLVAKLWLQLGTVSLFPLAWVDRALSFGLGLGLAISATSSLLYRLWPAYRESANLYLELVLKPLMWPDLIWLGLLPGLSEELLFRGVMLPAFGLDAVGVALSSVCFGVLHLSSLKHWPYMLWATIVGAILGVSALLSGNLLVPLVAHIVTNLMSGVLWKLGTVQGSNTPPV